MACSGNKPLEGAEEVVLDDEYLGTRRSKHVGVGDLLQSGGTGSSSLWVGDVSDAPRHGTGPGGITY